ncbi:hypothetical protein JXA84_09980 [candidate division WOR-3 bacterium]|nr:hypothetical protein [candidate division WOR-3 bacterium]
MKENHLRISMVVTMFVLFLVSLQDVFASTSPSSEQTDLRSKTEWVAFQFGVGTGLIAVHLDLITIRRPSFFWELLHYRSTGLLDFVHIEIGTLGGLPYRIGQNYELRTGLGLVYSYYYRDKRTWDGYGISPQISFLLTKSRKIKWEITGSLHLPISGKYGVDSEYKYLQPEPFEKPVIFTVCIGFRI